MIFKNIQNLHKFRILIQSMKKKMNTQDFPLKTCKEIYMRILLKTQELAAYLTLLFLW